MAQNKQTVDQNTQNCTCNYAQQHEQLTKIEPYVQGKADLLLRTRHLSSAQLMKTFFELSIGSRHCGHRPRAAPPTFAMATSAAHASQHST